MGAPGIFGALAVYPVYGPDRPGTPTLSPLHVALAEGQALVRELPRKEVNRLRFRNDGPVPALALSGTVFSGAALATTLESRRRDVVRQGLAARVERYLDEVDAAEHLVGFAVAIDGRLRGGARRLDGHPRAPGPRSGCRVHARPRGAP